MEAPDKIYFGTQQNTINPFSGLTQKCADTDVEYIRTDAFIDKAEKFFYFALNDGIMDTANVEDFIELFKNYMKSQDEKDTYLR